MAVACVFVAFLLAILYLTLPSASAAHLELPFQRKYTVAQAHNRAIIKRVSEAAQEQPDDDDNRTGHVETRHGRRAHHIRHRRRVPRHHIHHRQPTVSPTEPPTEQPGEHIHYHEKRVNHTVHGRHPYWNHHQRSHHVTHHSNVWPPPTAPPTESPTSAPGGGGTGGSSGGAGGLTYGTLPPAGVPYATREPYHDVDKADKADKALNNSGYMVPVNYDKNDLVYIGNVSVGNPQQSFNVTFDSSRSETFLIDRSCTACQASRKYDSENSSTFQNLGDNGNFLGFNGILSSDKWNVGYDYNFTSDFYRISSETNGDVEDEGINNGNYEGVIGLGLTRSEMDGNPLFIESALQGTPLPHVYSFHFHFPESSGGYMSIGGYSHRFYRGDLNTVNIIDGEDFFVTIQNAYIGLANATSASSWGTDEVSLGTAYDHSTCWGSLKTNSPVIYGPSSSIDNLARQVNATTDDSGSSYYTDCKNYDEMPTLIFRIGDQDYVIQGRYYVYDEPIQSHDNQCLVGIEVIPDSYAADWVLGEPFLRRVYTVFDVDNRQVRLAYSSDSGWNFAPSVGSTVALTVMSIFVIAVTSLAGF